MCPGRPRSSGLVLGSAKALMVSARSCEDTPVVQPSSLSTVTVKGVPKMEVLFATCLSNSSSKQRSSVMGAQSTPRPIVIIKFTFSGVINSAEVIKSPSFSRSSSSTTMMISPCRIASIASSILFSFIFSCIILLF